MYNKKLHDEMLQTAVKMLDGMLRDKTYSEENKIVPIRRVRRDIVSELNEDYQIPLQREQNGRLRNGLKAIVEEAANEREYWRYLVKVGDLYHLTGGSNGFKPTRVLPLDKSHKNKGWDEYWVLESYAKRV